MIDLTECTVQYLWAPVVQHYWCMRASSGGSSTRPCDWLVNPPTPPWGGRGALLLQLQLVVLLLVAWAAVWMTHVGLMGAAQDWQGHKLCICCNQSVSCCGVAVACRLGSVWLLPPFRCRLHGSRQRYQGQATGLDGSKPPYLQPKTLNKAMAGTTLRH